jgi:hypothetical protein
MGLSVVGTGDGSGKAIFSSLSSLLLKEIRLVLPSLPPLSVLPNPSFPLLELSLGKNYHKISSKGSGKKVTQEEKVLLIDLQDPQSIQSLLCVGGVVLVTLGLYFYYKRSEKKLRSQLEKPRDGIEGRYRMIGFSR